VELLFDGNSFHDNVRNSVRVGSALEVAEKETGEVCVHTLVARDEFVGEGETGHKAAK